MEYTVNAGDSLATIARDVLGNLTLWSEIAKLNGLAAPYVIYPGQVIQLPDPGTIQYGPATLAPTSPPSSMPAWAANPWVWIAAAAGALWWWKGRGR